MFPRLAAGATSGAGETSIAADVAKGGAQRQRLTSVAEQYYKLRRRCTTRRRSAA